MPIRRLEDGQWLLDVRPEKNKRVRKRYDGKLSRAQMRKIEAEFLANWQPVRERHTTLHEALERYWAEDGHRQRSAKDIDWQIGEIEDLTSPALTLRNVSAATAIDIRTRLTGGPAKRNRVLSRLRRVMNWGRKHWREPVQDIDWRDLMLEEPPVRDRWVSQDRRRKLWRASPPHVRRFISLSLLTGMRMANVLSLAPEHVDRVRWVVTLIGKGGKLQEVPLDRLAQRYLQRIWPDDDSPFIRYRGRPVASIKKAWARSCRDAGLEGVRIHDMRHTAAGDLYAATGDLELVRAALHHSSIATTQRYARAGIERVREGMEKRRQKV